jgi:3-oxoacyl-[acyl-carrier-protein] synthase III
MPHLTLHLPARARAARGTDAKRRASVDAGTLTLCGGAIVMPPVQTFNAIQADERHSGYRHLLLPQARFARPRGEGKLSAEEAVRLAPTGLASLPIAPPGQSLSDLAIDAALDLRDQMGSERLARTTHVVLASSSLNEKIGDSVVGRVQYELGLNHSTPFALGQNGTLGWYSALLLLDGMLGANDQALVVLSDKWLYPFFRQFGDLVGFGDAAAALLVSRAPDADDVDSACWGTVSSVVMEFGDAIRDPWGASPEAMRDALAPLAARTVRRALDAASHAPERIDWCVPSGFDASFASRVADCAAIPVSARVQHETTGHWSSADSAASVIRLAASLEADETRVALVWDAAMHGAAAAAVLELRGGFAAVGHIDGETP